MIQSWLDPGQNRESGGRTAEKTGYAADTDDHGPGEGPAR